MTKTLLSASKTCFSFVVLKGMATIVFQVPQFWTVMIDPKEIPVPIQKLFQTELASLDKFKQKYDAISDPEAKADYAEVLASFERLLNDYIKVLNISDSSSKKLKNENEVIHRKKAELETKSRALYQRSITDPLTQTYNRIYGLELLTDIILDSEAKPLTVMLIDIDHFKRINDELGHLAGDYILSKCADSMQSVLAEYPLSRYGGEEFLAILNGPSIEHAHSIAEKMREAVAEKKFYFNLHEIRLTISVGLAQMDSVKTVDHIISKADKALYNAKHSGRNAVKIYGQSEEYTNG